MKNSINDLRNHLFEVMEALKDEDKPMELQRAKAVCEVAQTIINSAKVEVDFLNAIDSSERTEFFNLQRIEERRSLAGGPVPEPRLRRIAG